MWKVSVRADTKSQGYQIMLLQSVLLERPERFELLTLVRSQTQGPLEIHRIVQILAPFDCSHRGRLPGIC
jgi:hypothetical protein